MLQLQCSCMDPKVQVQCTRMPAQPACCSVSAESGRVCYSCIGSDLQATSCRKACSACTHNTGKACRLQLAWLGMDRRLQQGSPVKCLRRCKRWSKSGTSCHGHSTMRHMSLTLQALTDPHGACSFTNFTCTGAEGIHARQRVCWADHGQSTSFTWGTAAEHRRARKSGTLKLQLWCHSTGSKPAALGMASCSAERPGAYPAVPDGGVGGQLLQEALHAASPLLDEVGRCSLALHRVLFRPGGHKVPPVGGLQQVSQRLCWRSPHQSTHTAATWLRDRTAKHP